MNTSKFFSIDRFSAEATKSTSIGQVAGTMYLGVVEITIIMNDMTINHMPKGIHGRT